MALLAIIHIPDHTAVADVVDSAGQMTSTMAYDGRVVGVFDFPNRRDLQCPGTCTRKGSGAWSREHIGGWMKCSICGSRAKKMRQWLIGSLFDLLGANLINDQAPAAFRTPEGYGPRDH